MLDELMFSLWNYAHGCRFDEILLWAQERGLDQVEVRAALKCLSRAGLLRSDEENNVERSSFHDQSKLVSAIIVSFNNREWLSTSLSSVMMQSYPLHEIILVDNASTDGSATWVEENYPSVKVVPLDNQHSLASAFNIGVEKATGDYHLLLNPDVKLEIDAIFHLVAAAGRNPGCAAVASKLKFLWAPSFLNGLGNYVGAFSWGTDVGLGHLDLGQFDSWEEVPSACFAAALIPAQVWKTVGPLDDNLPLYYEDSEWCYRARLLGYQVAAAPAAVVYHAFSGRIPTGVEAGLSAQKLRQVGYGRLHFVCKLLEFPSTLRFFGAYFIEDCYSLVISLAIGRWREFGSRLAAWMDFLYKLPEILQLRQGIQTKRVRSDEDIFQIQKGVPMPLIWHGLPLLTTDIVRHHYLPVIESGEVAAAKESNKGNKGLRSSFPERHPTMSLRRFFEIWKLEGMSGAIHRLWKYAQWVLMHP